MLASRKRTVALYQPPTDESCPLLVVLDGQDYRRRARITNIVDNLIALNLIRPVALAMPYHGRQARGVEYACSEATLGFLRRDLLELAGEELNLVDIKAHPGAYGILGASMEWLTQTVIRLFVHTDRYCTLAGGHWQTGWQAEGSTVRRRTP